MKFSIKAIVAAMILLPQFSFAQTDADNTGELKVMSYNIRLGSADDGTNSWQYRIQATHEMIMDQMPDVFGVQEALDYQILFMEEMCDGYKCVGVGREDGKKEGEHMSIFWNSEKVKLLKWGTFWLSETPEKPSKGWDAECKRTATWALMRDKRTGKRFYFVNTHLDHVGVEARKNGLKLVMERIDEINPDNYPMVLTGDFNIKPNAVELVELDSKMKSARKVALKTDNINTYNNWGKASSDYIIDYIYFSGFSSCVEYQTVTKRYSDRKFVSDHYPITARLIF